MTANEARDLVAKFKANGTEIGRINLEIKKLAEQGDTAYRHVNCVDSKRLDNLRTYFEIQGYKCWVEEQYHPSGVTIYNLVISWS